MKKVKVLSFSTFLALILIVLPIVIVSIVAEPPYSKNDVFNDIKLGDLWSDKAKYVDDWYAVEEIDEHTYIIGEPRSSQYNSSFLIIGNDKAILLDAGAGEHPANIPDMRKMAESLTDKPVTLMLSHFHVDHIGDLDKFDGIVMLDLPYLRSRIKNQNRTSGSQPYLRASVLETAIGARDIKVLDWVKPGENIDLGGRQIQVLSTPGHTFESLTLVDHENKYAFTGDLMYQHLGGFVAFLPGSDLSVYIEAIDALIAKTGEDYRFFGAHGLQSYSSVWMKTVHQEMLNVRDETVDLKMSETFMIPGLPLRLHQKGQILIYLTPFFDSVFMFSSRFILTLAMAFIILTALVYSVLKNVLKPKLKE